MSWLRKMVDLFSGGEAPPAKIDPREHVRQIVMTCGLTNERPEDVDFYVSAYEARRLNHRDVRKFGALLSDDEKHALGFPDSLILAREFVATLNEAGRADPQMAAVMIAQPAAQRCHSAAELLKIRQAGIELARFHASHQTAGSCAAAAKLDGARISVDKAALLPFDDCDRRGHCACGYQPWQNIADDMDDLLV